LGKKYTNRGLDWRTYGNQKNYIGGSSDDHKLFKPRTSTLHTLVLLFMRCSLPVPKNLKSKLQMFLIGFLEEMKIRPLIFQPTLQLGLQGSFQRNHT
jgi:hypothetical protein